MLWEPEKPSAFLANLAGDLLVPIAHGTTHEAVRQPSARESAWYCRNSDSGGGDPRCVLLASVPAWRVDSNQNERRRLVAEARFMAAALGMGLPLTNTNLTPFKREKLLSQFSDVSCERARLSRALQLLEAH